MQITETEIIVAIVALLIISSKCYRYFYPRPAARRSRLKKYKPSLYEKQGGVCNGCGGEYQMKDMAVDHIRPRNCGGTDIKSNLQLLCHHCNSLKGDRPMSYLLKKIERQKKRETRNRN